MYNNPMSAHDLIFIDTETTGLDCDIHEIIEIGAIVYNKKDDLVKETFSFKAAPVCIGTASERALELNGYRKNPSLYSGDIRLGIVDLNNMLEDRVIIGQNVRFDLRFLDKYFKKFNIKPKLTFGHRYVELMGLCWPVVYNENLTGNGLSDLCKFFKIQTDEMHSALADCKYSLDVYRKTIEYLKYYF